MPAEIVSVEGNQIKIELTVELSRSMMGTEEQIQASLNDAGSLATAAALKDLDTDGTPIQIGKEV